MLPHLPACSGRAGCLSRQGSSWQMTELSLPTAWDAAAERLCVYRFSALHVAQVISTAIQRQPVPLLARSLSVVEWSHLLGMQTSTRHSSRLSSSQASAPLEDLCLLSAMSVSVKTIPLAVQSLAQSAPPRVAFSLIANLNSPCCILIPLLLPQ